jgi:hypothetical protein
MSVAGRLSTVDVQDLPGDERGAFAWNDFAQEFAKATGARIVHIDDGGIAGSAFHDRALRLNAPLMLSVSNRMAIAGLGFLAIAMVGAVMLIANYPFSETLTVVSGIVAVLVFGGLWYALPIARSAQQSD